jgi:outer membrane protein assembly factor BamB
VITTKTTSYGLYVDNSTNNTFYDSIINATSAYDIYLQNGDSNNATYFINTTFNKSDISSSSSSVAAKLFNQYRLDVQVYNSTNPVESATVIGNDTDSVANLENPTSNFTNTTNSSGYITQQILTEFMANGTYNLGSYLYFNNYTITASKTGYTSNSTTTNLTSSQFLNITLTPVAAAQRVFWNQSSMSMGTIISGQTQSQNTTVNSTGSNTNINVSETSDQCNCFSATPLGPYSLGNGGSQQTQFSAAPQSGLTNGTTYSGTYIVNSTENGTIDQITISFVYRAENYWNQSSLSIGNVGNESAVSKNVTVNATGDTSDVEIYDVSGNGTFITADPYIIGNLNNGATHQVQFTCAPNTPTLGYYERIFSVNSTEMTSGRNITVSCNVFVTDNPPRWRYQSENATDIAVGEVVLLSAQGYDALGLWQAILSTNESGNWQNFTDNLYGSPINLNNQTGYSWSNFTWQNSSIINKTVSWKIYYKDNASQYNVTNTLDFWSGGALRGELSGPCTTNKNNPRDKCHSNIGENATFSLTFRYTDSPSYNSSYNGTIHLRYGISTNPRTDDASISIPQTTDCTGNTFIVKSTTINTCNGFINCGVAGNGDTNFYNTSQGINHELNVTFTVQSCANTSGKTYDIDANLVGTTTGRIISDSYLILHIIPKPFWNKTTSGELWSSPAVANLNGDSTIDIVIGDVDGTIHAYDGNNSTEVWNTSTGAEIWSSPTVADVWNNGTAYVAIGDGNNVSLIHGKTGKMVWNKTTGDLVASTPAFYDINGDGILDVIVGSSDNSVYALYGNNGSQIWSYPTEAMIWTSSPVIANVVGSLAPEVIIGSNDANMYALNITNGNKLWNTSVYDANVYLNGGTDGSATVADINSDGVQEVVFGSYNGNIYALRGDNGNQVWSFPTGSWIMSSPIAVHLFNDDTWQIVFGSHSPDGRVYALNGENGTQIWNQSVRGHADSPPTILDVDGDGYKDVVTGSSNWSVYAFNGIDGNIMWLYNVNNYVMGSPAVSDLNADGHPEIVALTTEGKSIVTIDPPGESDSFRGGEFRTGTYDNNPPQYSKSGYNPTSSGLFLYSFWKDSLSNLVKAEIRENSTGQWTATSIDLKGVSAWINYTISKLEKDKTLSFSITVFDDYGNKNTYAGSYSSAVSVSGPSASQPVCGNSICESGETTQSCPQDCPTGAAPTPIQLPSSPIFDFLPLIIGVVLVVFIVLAFVVL